MSSRFWILIAVAVILALLAAWKFSSPPAPENGSDFVGEPIDPETNKLLSQRDLPGIEPPEEPEVDIQVEVNTSSGKNRLDYYISESHGYYVEVFKIDFFWKETPEMEYDESPLVVSHYDDVYVRANETLKHCLEIVPAELTRVGGDIGTTENWGAIITWHGRAREQDPDPLPKLANIVRCD